MRHVNRLAHNLKREGDPRSLDQLRVDITLDLMCGGAPGEGTGVLGRWRSPSTSPPSSDCPTPRGTQWLWTGDSRRRPLDHQPSTRLAVAWSPSPTPTTGRCCGTAPPGEDRAPGSAARWKPGHPPVSSPVAACRPQPATSTTPSTTPAGDQPPKSTWDRCAGTTTWSSTVDGGNYGEPQTATHGPADSDTPITPGQTRRHEAGGGNPCVRSMVRAVG